MASAKKKLDEYHLKVLRQLVTLPANKECFDCHQRGPTYVNVTIGSFVCTTCSGMLRGLTPPHRVKSISMATFTPEEIDFVKDRGNDFCRRTWLGLLDSQQPTKDEQQIKDFMIAKYERKRYYIDPAVASAISKTTNGNSPSPSKSLIPSQSTSVTPALPTNTAVHPHPTTLAFKAPTPQTNSNTNMFTPEPFADFSNLSIPPPCDPFNSSQSAAAPTSAAQPSFANFDNNPVFNNSSSTASLDIWTEIATLSPPLFKVPMRPISGRASCPPTNRWSVPGVGEAGTVPGEDRYAALKDLDCLMKSQQQQQAVEPPASGVEWSSGLSNGITNVWSAPTLFPSTTLPAKDATVMSNPFKGEGSWNNGDVGANPFRHSRPISTAVWSGVTNGQMSNGFTTSQSLNFSAPKVPWNNESINNPFMLGTSPQTAGHHSSNPFL
ncbi:arf-GAP domain and FG repeat-containing protein 1 isoform X2 [Homalodisca vitripennis]|uniref:arf-GAP domain and FG repeat-containing protein 1 isoform X2 n=1 Tax=Homalodisca vitripennis TaxID=197043 RepID=UPI001EE9DFC3|nr:arf-GAP domain and FG repeat-containing protein 1 isoform X2 [Homalodisca vitripennis]